MRTKKELANENKPGTLTNIPPRCSANRARVIRMKSMSQPSLRVVEIYGPESSGKTTLALHTIAEAQKRGGICGFIDAEHALDTIYARKLGVDLENLLISQPD